METEQNINILNTVNFKLVFDRIPDVEYFTSNLSVPSVSTDSPIIPTAKKNTIFLPGSQIVFDPFVLNFIIDEDMRTYKSLYSWMIDAISVDDPRKIWSDMKVHVLTGNMNTNLILTFVNIFPVDLDGIEFDSQASDSEPVTAGATFNYAYYYFDGVDNLASNYTPHPLL